jgi:DNA-binding transcriptional MocR family regulator
MGNVTLKTVAEAAGVSISTVSNAYNRPEQMSAEVRQRILETAQRLGYAGPNAAARSLRGTSAARRKQRRVEAPNRPRNPSPTPTSARMRSRSFGVPPRPGLAADSAPCCRGRGCDSRSSDPDDGRHSRPQISRPSTKRRNTSYR